MFLIGDLVLFNSSIEIVLFLIYSINFFVLLVDSWILSLSSYSLAADIYGIANLISFCLVSYF